MIDYYEIIMNGILSFFSLSESSDVTPFFAPEGLHVEVRAVKEDVKKIIAIITDQVELERLQVSPIFSPHKCRTFLYDALFKAVERCFHRPTFHCLIVKNFHLTTTTILDVLQGFLVSTACQEQQFMLKNVTIDSSDVKKSISYASDSQVCRKSLRVEGCSVTDEGIFSIVDIASVILLHPGINSRMASVQTSGFLITWHGIPEVIKMGDPCADDLVRQKSSFSHSEWHHSTRLVFM